MTNIPNTVWDLKSGDIVEGVVETIGQDGAIVKVGNVRTWLPMDKFDGNEFAVGDTVIVKVLGILNEMRRVSMVGVTQDPPAVYKNIAVVGGDGYGAHHVVSASGKTNRAFEPELSGAFDIRYLGDPDRFPNEPESGLFVTDRLILDAALGPEVAHLLYIPSRLTVLGGDEDPGQLIQDISDLRPSKSVEFGGNMLLQKKAKLSTGSRKGKGKRKQRAQTRGRTR